MKVPELPDLTNATRGDEIARERINWLQIDQLIQLSFLEEETIMTEIAGFEYVDEIQNVINRLYETRHDDMFSQRGIQKIVQRKIDCDDEHDRFKRN